MREEGSAEKGVDSVLERREHFRVGPTRNWHAGVGGGKDLNEDPVRSTRGKVGLAARRITSGVLFY